MNDIHKLKEVLSAPKNIVIVPHKNPDGDAIGSTLGLYHYLIGLNHQAVVIAPNDYPEFLKWIPGEHTILKFDIHKEEAIDKINTADLIFTLDFNALGRVDEMGAYLKNAEAQFVMIDHHQQPESYAIYMYSDVSMSSTCQMVYHFLEQLEALPAINADIATCLYTGILTDTGGSFRFKGTTSTTHRVVADLIDKGADGEYIQQQLYDTKSLSRLQLLGCALRNLTVLDDFNTAFITLSQNELKENHFKKGDTEGFVNYALSLKGIRLAVIFIDNENEDFIKISFRSKGNFSVNEFARAHFNGGGHTNAAGGKSDLSLIETTTHFTELLKKYKPQLQ